MKLWRKLIRQLIGVLSQRVITALNTRQWEEQYFIKNVYPSIKNMLIYHDISQQSATSVAIKCSQALYAHKKSLAWHFFLERLLFWYTFLQMRGYFQDIMLISHVISLEIFWDAVVVFIRTAASQIHVTSFLHPHIFCSIRNTFRAVPYIYTKHVYTFTNTVHMSPYKRVCVATLCGCVSFWACVGARVIACTRDYNDMSVHVNILQQDVLIF